MMKIVNEKGKLFGIINIVDLAVLLVVLLLAYAAAVKFTGGQINTPITSSRKLITVTVKAPSKSNFMVDVFEKGDQLMYGNLFIDDTYIKKVESEPTMVNVQLPSGDIVPTQDPVYKDIYITFTAPVDPGSNVIKIGDSLIRVGAQFNLFTKNAYTMTYVMSVEYDK